jgi:phosphoserine aminotransferase
MLCVEDYLDALSWARSIGGLPALVAKSQANFDVLAAFVAQEPWIDFLCTVPEQRSNTSVRGVHSRCKRDEVGSEGGGCTCADTGERLLGLRV